MMRLLCLLVVWLGLTAPLRAQAAPVDTVQAHVDSLTGCVRAYARGLVVRFECVAVAIRAAAPDTVRETMPPLPPVHDTLPWRCPVGWTCTGPVTPPRDTTPSTPPTGRVGIGYGLYATPDLAHTAPLTAAHEGLTPASLVREIATARAHGVRLVLAMTGGHLKNMSVIRGVMQFDHAKYLARLRTFDTPANRKAVADGVADGTIVGANVMDEPHVAGAGDGAGSGDGNTWGPRGTMTKIRVDSLCGDVQSIFPTLPVGPAHSAQIFEPTRSYRVCDFLIAQYSARFGDVGKWVAENLATGRRDRHKIMFSINVLNGGTQDRDGTWDCKAQGGVKGQDPPNCAPTPAQVKSWGLALGSATCGTLLSWRYDAASFARLQSSFRAVADSLGHLPATSCRR